MKKLVFALAFWGCAPAAYELVRPDGDSRAEVATQDPGPQAPGGATPPATEPPPAPPPPVQPSEPPVPPDDLDPDSPVQQEPPQCNMITLCSRLQLPYCGKANDGLQARVMGAGMFVCQGGKWVPMEAL